MQIQYKIMKGSHIWLQLQILSDIGIDEFANTNLNTNVIKIQIQYKIMTGRCMCLQSQILSDIGIDEFANTNLNTNANAKYNIK